MKITETTLVVALALGMTGVAYAAKGDAKAGEEKAAACMGCHGADGNSEVPSFPSLAGQYAAYTAKQVMDFIKETRTDETMAPMAAAAGEYQDALDIGAYFEKQKLAKGTPGPNAAKGKQVYAQYNCASCHGESGKGKGMAMFPVINSQHKDYLVKTLTDFKTGDRKNDATTMMSAIAKKMSEAEIDAVADYLTGE